MRIARKTLQAWADEVKSRLGLDDWTVQVTLGKAGTKNGRVCMGECNPEPAERTAKIVIDTRHIPSLESAKRIVIHEVAHILIAKIDCFVEDVAHKLYPRNDKAFAEFVGAYENLCEDVVERLARGLSE